MSKTIKELRKSLGLSQIDFSKKINISRSSLALIETNKTKPSVELYEKINEVYGVNLIQSNNNIVINKNNSVSKTDKLVGYEEFQTLYLLYTDNMKTIYFLTSLLRKHNYKFNKTLIKELKLYESMEDIIWDIQKNFMVDDTSKNKQIIPSTEHLIKVNMFRTIGDLMNDATDLLNFETEYSFEWLK